MERLAKYVGDQLPRTERLTYCGADEEGRGLLTLLVNGIPQLTTRLQGGHANRRWIHQKQNQVSSPDRARNSAVSASWSLQKRLAGWETIRCW